MSYVYNSVLLYYKALNVAICIYSYIQRHRGRC